MGDKKSVPVRVALRIRPLSTKEIDEGAKSFISKVPGQPQIAIKGAVGADEAKAYTYDFAFGPEEPQSDVFETAVKKIVQKIFHGYNVTILAYGQTGSGKTFTMGTAETSDTVDQSSGIIQRAVMELFTKMAEKADFSFEIKISFLELYMEKVYDLLSDKRAERDIREDPNTGIQINGLTETSVSTWEETLKCLEEGSLIRRTGATAMNQQSSRSHAVFTLTVNQISKESKMPVKSSKFHLVDLAGSERASKTQAVGDRFNEGVNINKGLLSLGNVISALCEGNGRHIPYRDSKLTRLLQDSLGGNSYTLMIACVSPADSNREETMSTLRYADRARKIKNKPIVNQDPTQVELTRLRTLLAQYLSAGAGSGTANSAEVEQMKQQLLLSEDENLKLMQALQSSLEENTNMSEKALLAEAANQQMKQCLEELQISTDAQLSTMRVEVDQTRLQFNLELDEKAAIIADQTLTENSLRAEIKEHLEKIKALEEFYSSLQSSVVVMDLVDLSSPVQALQKKQQLKSAQQLLPAMEGSTSVAPSTPRTPAENLQRETEDEKRTNSELLQDQILPAIEGDLVREEVENPERENHERQIEICGKTTNDPVADELIKEALEDNLAKPSASAQGVNPSFLPKVCNSPSLAHLSSRKGKVELSRSKLSLLTMRNKPEMDVSISGVALQPAPIEVLDSEALDQDLNNNDPLFKKPK